MRYNTSVMKPGFGRVAIWCALSLLPLPAAAADSDSLLRALLKPDLAALAPAAVSRRFAKCLPLERAQPFPGQLILAGGDTQQRLEFLYTPDTAGKQRFARAEARFLATSQETPFRDLERGLRKRLGEPRYERRDDGPMPTIGWRLGQLEVSLSLTELRNAQWVELSIVKPRVQAASNL